MVSTVQDDELGEGEDDEGKEQPSTTGSLGIRYYLYNGLVIVVFQYSAISLYSHGV